MNNCELTKALENTHSFSKKTYKSEKGLVDYLMINFEEIKCAICKEQAKNTKITTCCEKYVCFSCWDIKVRESYKPNMNEFYRRFYCRFYFCQVGCNKRFHQRPSIEASNLCLFLRDISIQCKSKLIGLPDLVITCPHQTCKVSFLFSLRGKSSMLAFFLDGI